jgi:hypothetical protein
MAGAMTGRGSKSRGQPCLPTPPLQYASSSSGNVTSTIPNSKWRKCEALSIV